LNLKLIQLNLNEFSWIWIPFNGISNNCLLKSIILDILFKKLFGLIVVSTKRYKLMSCRMYKPQMSFVGISCFLLSNSGRPKFNSSSSCKMSMSMLQIMTFLILHLLQAFHKFKNTSSLPFLLPIIIQPTSLFWPHLYICIS
jgi:hypothetical protein